MKRVILFMMMLSLSAACFAFGPKDGRKNWNGHFRKGRDCGPSQRCETSPRFEKRDMEPRMYEFLDLSAEQKKQMQTIRKKHRDQMFDLRTDIQKAKIDKRISLKKHDFDKAKKHVKAINQTNGKIQQKRIEMMEDCYNVLTKEQKAKL